LISISLPVFRTRSPVKIFWSKNRLFSAFAAHLCGMSKISLGESYFLPNHNFITYQALTNSANGSV